MSSLFLADKITFNQKSDNFSDKKFIHGKESNLELKNF